MLEGRKALLDAIQLGETTFLELKEVRFAGSKLRGPGRDVLADELAAFANGRGGVCVLGVNDRREVVGIPDDRLSQVTVLVRDICTDLVDPPLVPVIDLLRLPSNTGEEVAVVKVEIERSPSVHRSPGGHLHRVGDSKRRMSQEYLERQLRERSRTRFMGFDEQIVPGATVEALRPELWDRFRTARTGGGRYEVLSKLHMARRDRTGAPKPTVAGILMASADPRRWLPNAFIQAVAYRGRQVRPRGRESAYQVDAQDISGPLDAQVEDACRFVVKNMRVEGFKSLGRVDRAQFDITAVFEAVVNAVAHRDYSMHGSKIRLQMFSDRLELYSPGAIVNSMTVESLVHLQASRNEVLTSLLAKCAVPEDVPWLATDRENLMDKRGEGVRIVLENSLELSGMEPVYRLIADSELLLTIYAASSTGSDEGE